MAIIHRAYQFKRKEFYNKLEKFVNSNGEVEFYKLQEYSNQLLRDKKNREIAIDLSCEINLNIDTSYANVLKIILSSCLTHGFSLSRFTRNEQGGYGNQVSEDGLEYPMHGHNLLKDFLLLVGWREQEVATLLTGKELDSLIWYSGNPFIVETFIKTNLGKGWLPTWDINFFHIYLEHARTLKNNLTKEILENNFKTYLNLSSMPLEYLLEITLNDGIIMLSQAIQQKLDVFLVLD